MVVQFILAVRKGRREVKLVPENKEGKVQLETRTEDKSAVLDPGEINCDASTKSEIISKDSVPPGPVDLGAGNLKHPDNLMDVGERSEHCVDVSLSIKGGQQYEDKISCNKSSKHSISITSLCEEKPVTSKQTESADEMKLKVDRVRDPLTVKEESSIRERFKQDLVHSKSDVQYVEVEEYFVKYRNFSYLHCEWKTEDELFKGDKRISAKLKRFKQKMAHHANIFENVSLFQEGFVIVLNIPYLCNCYTSYSSA
jgi:chromodomain-helicase-DNA-binding protein 7